jgi:hypothetical protein
MLEIVLSGCDILLIGVISFLVVTVAAGSDCILSKVPLVPSPVVLDGAT